jgi:predicted outer membrane repeat protein
MRAVPVAVVVLALTLATTPAAPRTWQIMPDGSGDAPTIQAGLDSASMGDTVLVSDGTYFEHEIVMKSRVCLRGSATGPSHPVVSGQRLGRVFYCNDLHYTTRIEALEIVNGFAEGSGVGAAGGGILIIGSSLTISDCKIAGNESPYGGGGVWCGGSATPTLSGCILEENRSPSGGGAGCSQSAPNWDHCAFIGNMSTGAGGGVWSGSSNASFVSCSFVDNLAGGEGGGLHAAYEGPVVTDCEFKGNHAASGGGMSCRQIAQTGSLTGCLFLGNSAGSGGGFAALSLASPSFTDCVFTENSSTIGDGGAVWAQDSAPPFSQCVFLGNSADDRGGAIHLHHTSSTVRECVFSGNSARLAGGAVHSSGQSSAHFIDCTFWGNSGVPGAGLAFGSSYYGADPTIENTIVAGNLVGEGVSCPAEIVPILTCCDLNGNAGGDWVGYIADQGDSNGNMSADPVFCDAQAGDFTLHLDSPCLDAPGCGQIGTYGLGCGVSTGVPAGRSERTSWSGLKRMFSHRAVREGGNP